MHILFGLLIACSLFSSYASAQTRTVSLSWTASASTGVTGYNVYRATSAAGPFTLLNTSQISTTTYNDVMAAIGQTYTYQVTAVAPPCTPTTPATSSCGESAPSVPATTTVPARPSITVSVTVAVQ